MADILFSAPRLEAIAASEVINIFYSIQRIVKKHQNALCYCHYKLNCKACIISGYLCNFYKRRNFARRNFKGLLADFNRMVELKIELIEEAGYKIICFDDEIELAFFSNKLPILTHSYCTPKEILFSIECSDYKLIEITKKEILLLN